jgi:NAD(P)-dependent dehydrogenase (short-subunit alcohol dehydrogenase family)
VTIVGLRPFVTVHLFAGLMLIPPVVELAPHGIPVVSIPPTGVETPLNDGLAAMEGRTPQTIAETSAGNRLPVPWIDVSDVAEAVRFPVGDKVRHMTGTEFLLDAGVPTR